jgi:UDP-glucose 4-epimerase
MNILITGAFGNIGLSTVKNLVEKKHKITCFDIENDNNLKKSATFGDKILIKWGDLKNFDQVTQAVKEQDAVIHLGFIIPPLSEEKPELAREVNVGGTKNLVNALVEFNNDAKIIFASSVSVYGSHEGVRPPRKATDPIIGTDNYSTHKVECENIVRNSALKWVITRFGVVPPFSLGGKIDSMLFEMPLDSRIEFVHTLDVGLALANASECEQCVGKILLIGGGAKCQVFEREFLSKFLNANGIDMLPDEAFGHKPYYTDWMDTEESQRLLQYQRYTYDDFIKQMTKMAGYRRIIAKILGPIIRNSILKQSPYYKEYLAKKNYKK